MENYYKKYLKNRHFSEAASDFIASVVGSWYFILTQTSIITFWIVANTHGIFGIPKWDPYPFIFLNLTLSFQAAYTAPIIMMSQNRQANLDRQAAEEDYKINRIAEQEIEAIQEDIKILSKENIPQDLIIKEIQDIKNHLQELKELIAK